MSNIVQIVNEYPEQLPIGNPRQSQPPADGGGKNVDSVLGAYLVDGVPNNAPRLRNNPRVRLGVVPQRNHKALVGK